MKSKFTNAAVAILAAGAAQAGGIERTQQSTAVLFEEGRYGEFSLGFVTPDVTGVSINQPLLPNGSGSGDIAKNYLRFGAAYKADINDRWSYAVILDQPFGANTEYPSGTGYFADGSNAEFNSAALTGLAKYRANNGFSVFGGLRLQSVDANVKIALQTPVGGPIGGLINNIDYTADADVHYGLGYVLGTAYEKPEIGLRVALTYNSKIKHSVDTFETNNGLGGPVTRSTSTDFETPQSVNLEFQTGVRPTTLLFGGVRWVDWSNFVLDPSLYKDITLGANLLSYQEDVITYRLGLGQKINDTWSVAATLGYEKNTGNLFTNLGPADGQQSIELAAIYRMDKVKVTTGVRYVQIGDTTTGLLGQPAAAFNDNTALAFGVRVGYYF